VEFGPPGDEAAARHLGRAPVELATGTVPAGDRAALELIESE
jgi:hypothetical protein